MSSHSSLLLLLLLLSLTYITPIVADCEDNSSSCLPHASSASTCGVTCLIVIFSVLITLTCIGTIGYIQVRRCSHTQMNTEQTTQEAISEMKTKLRLEIEDMVAKQQQQHNIHDIHIQIDRHEDDMEKQDDENTQTTMIPQDGVWIGHATTSSDIPSPSHPLSYTLTFKDDTIYGYDNISIIKGTYDETSHRITFVSTEKSQVHEQQQQQQQQVTSSIRYHGKYITAYQIAGTFEHGDGRQGTFSLTHHAAVLPTQQPIVVQ